jgi:CDP-diacylglycerol---glycerol-3-phosphate 3-phosphatidyltransferase
VSRLGRLTHTLPNALTVARVLAIPPIVALLLESGDGSSAAAAGLFALAALSDALDGHLARSRDLVTTFGKIADPIADKLLVGAALASLVAVHRLAAWIAVVIVTRELAVSALRAVAGREGLVISASRFGKLKMAFQVATILALIAAPDASALWLQSLLYVTVAVTIASGVDYFLAFRRRGRAVPVRVPARKATAVEQARGRASP